MYVHVHENSCVAKDVQKQLTNKHNKQAATMAFKIHKTRPQRA